MHTSDDSQVDPYPGFETAWGLAGGELSVAKGQSAGMVRFHPEAEQGVECPPVCFLCVQVQHAMRLDPRVEFHRVTIRAEVDGLKAYSTGGQRSSRVASLSGANGLVQLPALTEGGPTVLQAGEIADAIVIGELRA